MEYLLGLTLKYS